MFDTMYRMHLVTPEKELKHVLTELVLTDDLHLVDATEWTEANLVSLRSEADQKGKGAQDGDRGPFATREELETVGDQLAMLKDLLEAPETTDLRRASEKSFVAVKEEVEDLHRSLVDVTERIRLLEGTAEKLKRLEAIRSFGDLEIDFSRLQGMKHFAYRIGTLAHRERARLERNEENIVALFFWIDRHADEGLLFVLMPRAVEEETDRILRSVTFDEIKVPDYLAGKPTEMIGKINAMAYDVHFELLTLREQLDQEAKRHGEQLGFYEARLALERRLVEADRLILRGDHRVYLSVRGPKAQIQRVGTWMEKRSPDTRVHVEKEVK